MTSVVYTNLASLVAQRGVSRTQSDLETAITRLSSGLRINNAGDDAADLSISDRFSAQIRGLNQATRNTNDGISLAQTADGGLATATTLMQRMRELAVEAANGSNSASDRASLQLEVSQLSQEVDRIALNTRFNGKGLLDGSLTSQQLQVGGNVGQVVNFGIASARLSDLVSTTVTTPGAPSSYTLSSSAAAGDLGFGATGSSFQKNNVRTDTLTVSGSAGSAAVSYGNSDFASWIAAAVNLQSGSTGVTATARTTVELSFTGFPGMVHMLFEGANPAHSSPGGNTVPIDADCSHDFNDLADAFNAQTGVTGVTAVATATGVILTSAAGDDLAIDEMTCGNAGPVQFFDSSGGYITHTAGSTDSVTIGGIVTFASSNAFTVTNPLSNDHFFGTGGTHAATAGATGPPTTVTTAAAIDVSTVAGANAAITAIDQALSRLGNNRAALGALQNRLGSALNNDQAASANASAARSRIVDADFAVEVGAMTRAQIVQNAGLAMVAQANAAPASALALLKSATVSG